MTTILDRVRNIIFDVFDDDELDINEKTCATDVDGWDSLTHISIIAGIESEFGIRFTVDEVQHMKNVGEMVEIIDQKMR